MRVAFVYMFLYEKARLKDAFVGWWSYVMVQISRVSFQLPLVTKRLCPHLNEMYIWFRSPPHMSILSSSSLQFIVVFIVISCTCLLEMLIFAIVFLPSSDHLSPLGMGGSDLGGSIQQPLVEWEVIPIGDSSSKETCHKAFDSESSSFERLLDLRHVDEGSS